MSWRRFFSRAWWDAERQDELAAYLQIEIDDQVARGRPPAEARAAAYRKLGNPTLIREEIYRMNSLRALDTLWHDVRFGARVLRRSPTFAAVAVLSLALGVGANTAIFQLLDAVRLRTLPVSHPESLVEIQIAHAPNGRTGDFISRRNQLTHAIWERVRDEQRVFAGAFAWSSATLELAAGGESHPAQGLFVSGEFFGTLGVPPAAGRVFTDEDDRRGCASPGVVISYPFWQRTFGGAAGARGTPLRLDGHPFEIIGVTPATFSGVEVGYGFDVALPICAEPILRRDRSALDRPDVWWLSAIGRLRPDVTVAQASAQLASIAPGIFQATLPPNFNADDTKSYLAFSLQAVPAGTGVSTLRRTYEAPLGLLLAIAGLVLLVACGNLANLMLARAAAREREMAVRLAIGASRFRIVHQLMVESLMIAAAGAAVGIVLAGVLSRSLVAFLSTASEPLFFDLHADGRVIAFTSGLAVLTCVLFGLVPALRATRTPPGAVMKAGGRGLTGGRDRAGLRRALVVGQMALSLVLIVGAGLFVRTLVNLATRDPGFRTRGVLVARFDLRPARVPPDRRSAFQHDLVDRLQKIAGVDAAAGTSNVPVSGNVWNDTIVIDGVVQKTYPNINQVGRSYFQVMSIPLLAGRPFSARDVLGAPRVAIVSRAFTQAFFPGQNAVGRSFRFERGPSERHDSYEIVGVAGDTQYADLREPAGPIIYFPDTQDDEPGQSMTVLVRAGAASSGLTAAITEVAREANPGILVSVTTLEERVRASLLRERLMATLSGWFAGLAGLLAAIGLYGVMAYGVARRTSEIGIRMALGASRPAVVGLILREAAWLVGVGLALGLGLSVLAARSAATLLFNLTPSDPATLVMAATVLAVVAAAASAWPALSAARLSPTTALKED